MSASDYVSVYECFINSVILSCRVSILGVGAFTAAAIYKTHADGTPSLLWVGAGVFAIPALIGLMSFWFCPPACCCDCDRRVPSEDCEQRAV